MLIWCVFWMNKCCVYKSDVFNAACSEHFLHLSIGRIRNKGRRLHRSIIHTKSAGLRREFSAGHDQREANAEFDLNRFTRSQSLRHNSHSLLWAAHATAGEMYKWLAQAGECLQTSALTNYITQKSADLRKWKPRRVLSSALHQKIKINVQKGFFNAQNYFCIEKRSKNKFLFREFVSRQIPMP